MDVIVNDLDAWEMRQAQVREIIYSTVSKTMYIQIKAAESVSMLWERLGSIHEIENGPLVHADILAKLQNSRYNGKNMRMHITTMRKLRDQLDASAIQSMTHRSPDMCACRWVRRGVRICQHSRLEHWCPVARLTCKYF